MEAIKHCRAIVLLSATAGAAATTAAADVSGYAGLAISDIELEATKAIGNSPVVGTELGIRFFGGLFFSEYFAVEGSYLEASGYDTSFTYQYPGGLPFLVNFDAKYKIVAARAIGNLALGQFDLFAGIGAYDAELEGTAVFPVFDAPFGTDLATADRGESGLTGIAGIAYRLGDFMAIRLDFEWFDMEPGTETYGVSFGLTYRF